jgi:AraC family transcriptional regulator
MVVADVRHAALSASIIGGLPPSSNRRHWGSAVTDLYHSLPAFDATNPHLRTTLAGEELILTRVAHAPDEGTLELTAAPQDAFALIFQLGQVPEHAMSHDGQRHEIAAGPAHAITSVDLAGQVTARIGCAFDSLNFRVPRAALDIFADQAGSSRVSRLHLPGEAFSNVDPVIGEISPALVGAMCAERASPLFADHLLLSLLAHVLARYGDGRRSAVRACGGLSPWQERRARAMLDPGGGSAPTLTQVATACSVSVAHFSRAFRISVGVSPWAWHQSRRIEHALVLLRDAALPLAQVAAVSGFADQSHFTRVFAGQVGKSPGQWRRERGVH